MVEVSQGGLSRHHPDGRARYHDAHRRLPVQGDGLGRWWVGRARMRCARLLRARCAGSNVWRQRAEQGATRAPAGSRESPRRRSLYAAFPGEAYPGRYSGDPPGKAAYKVPRSGARSALAGGFPRFEMHGFSRPIAKASDTPPTHPTHVGVTERPSQARSFDILSARLCAMCVALAQPLPPPGPAISGHGGPYSWRLGNFRRKEVGEQ